MGKSFKRLLAERRRQHKQLPAKEEILEQVVEIKQEPRVVSVVEKVELEEIAEEDEISSEDLAKSVLQAQSKKGAVKKK